MFQFLFFLDPDCAAQEDYYDADNNYLKTVCTYRADVTRDAAAIKCNSMGMKLANPDDDPESLGVLIQRASFEYYGGGVLWVRGLENGKCSILKWISNYNYNRQYVSCSESHYAYCEFNSELKF
jgi:hypothetical protein